MEACADEILDEKFSQIKELGDKMLATQITKRPTCTEILLEINKLKLNSDYVVEDVRARKINITDDFKEIENEFDVNFLKRKLWKTV
jgi:hypothetical protein